MKRFLTGVFGACVCVNILVCSTALTTGDWHMGLLGAVSAVLCGYGLWRALSSA